jgi:hypothetical protein
MLTSLKYFHELTLPDGSQNQPNKKNGNNSHILNGNYNNNIDVANNGHARIHSNHNNNHNSSHNNSHNNVKK